MSRRGRPIGASGKGQRAAKKMAWAREQEHRRKEESLIEQGLAETPTWREAIDQLDPLRAELFIRLVCSPALRFVDDKIKNVPDNIWRGLSPKQREATYLQAFIDLMLSDVPLDNDKDARRTIAGVMQRVANPDLMKLARDRATLAVIREALASAEQRGETAEDVRTRLAKEFGRASGESLRKWMKEHKPEDN